MVGALVLAGGASRRMGRDKAWLTLEGVPLLRRVVDLVAQVATLVVVAAAPGQDLPALPEGVLRVDDPIERHGRGPLVGILAGLAALDAGGVEIAVVSSCDAAGLELAHLHFVLERLAARPDAAGVVPVEAGRLHPLAGALRVAPSRARAQALLDAGEGRLSEWARGFATIDADELPDRRVLLPCNDPEQWARVQALA